jgi:nitroimidazol reductase NimA-like FMN-containing flavoprotein (pyridoxamine 5'-phosphate oxidase superfamily)
MAGNSISWPGVAARLAPARSYWLGTTSPAGAPHAAPVWGAVTGDTLYLYSERSTRKARNLAADPRLVLHTESADDVLIVHGTAERRQLPAESASMQAVEKVLEIFRALVHTNYHLDKSFHNDSLASHFSHFASSG